MNVRLPIKLQRRLDVQCDRRGFSRSALIRYALEGALERWEDESDRLDLAAMECRA